MSWKCLEEIKRQWSAKTSYVQKMESDRRVKKLTQTELRVLIFWPTEYAWEKQI